MVSYQEQPTTQRRPRSERGRGKSKEKTIYSEIESPEDALPPIEEAPTERPQRPDDDQLALILAEQWQGKVATFHEGWHVYENGVWVYRDFREVKKHIRSFLRTQRGKGVAVTQRQITSLGAMMEDDVFIPDRRLMDMQAEATKYINLRNGLYNLETHQFEDKHRPDLMMTTQLDFNYDPEASCPNFTKFLYSSLRTPDGKEVDHDLVGLMQQAMAYSMTARTDMKASFWLWGKPDSGKSTTIAFIRNLMGNLHATIDLNQLATNRFLLSGIVGKRVVSFTESGANSILPDALYKAMVGGEDEIYVDVKNKAGFAFKPTAKFWWAMNDAPRINDRTGATFNRLKIIPFNRSIPKDERDPYLLSKLLAEKPGIFNSLMTFYIQLQNNKKFREVKQSAAIAAEYQLENDTEMSFLDDCCERHPSFTVQSSILYRRYNDWCKDNGFYPKNANQIASEWRRLGFTSKKSNGNTVWMGLQLRDLRATK